MNAMLLTDGYKLDHCRQYPVGTQFVYSNWTARSNNYLHEASLEEFKTLKESKDLNNDSKLIKLNKLNKLLLLSKFI